MTTKNKTTSLIGIIAEDNCDVESIRILISRINGKNIGVKKFVGKGCGKISRKSNAWAKQLKQKGCSTLILVHDLDSNNLNDLNDRIKSALEPSAINKYLICIPIQELEAWLLCDPEAIKLAMNLRKLPKVVGRPETINSPKEYLGEIIYKASDNERIYINTKHNEKISSVLSIDKALRLCPSFIPFHSFVEANC